MRLINLNLMASNEERDMGILRLRINYSIMNTIQNVSTIEIGQDGYLKVTTETSDTIRGDQSSDVSMLRSDETVI